jgi:(1->4)-alpha-D-glucan 1-alpha-D-glucosylmutase
MVDGRVKLYVTWQGLAARAAQRQLFATGEYVALETAGTNAHRLCAFARANGAAASITVVPRLVAGLPTEAALPLGHAAWGDTRVVLPQRLARRYRNVFTGEEHDCEGAATLDVAAVLAHFPVAILIAE